MKRVLASLAGAVAVAVVAWAAEGVDPAVQAKIDAAMKDMQSWAADPAVVAAVKEANAQPSAEAKAMTQEKWKALAVTDPFIKALASNAAAKALKGHKTPVVSEAFLSAADGTKVALFSKTTSWSHKGKAKHDDPMAGKNWEGSIEVDESSGVQQVQVAVPVKDGDHAIGSLVVGFNVTKMKE